MSSNNQATGTKHADFLVIGAGPGGYTAAFRAADLGRNVTLVDPNSTLGGVCLNVGCIPSKALLHVAKLREDARDAADLGAGVDLLAPDIVRIRAWKDSVVAKLTSGLNGLARRRRVTIVRGTARFTGPDSVEIATADGPHALRFNQAVVATGSEPVRLPFLPDDSRIMDSTGALALAEIPERLLVIGGGIIGLEMAQIYHALGSRIEIIEQAAQILPGADPDIIAPLARRISDRYAAIRTDTAITGVEAGKRTLRAHFHGPDGTGSGDYDRILVAVGRRPNSAGIDAQAAGVVINERGFVTVDAQMRSANPQIFAIGDLVGQPMLAHKATHEGKIAAEAACGHKVAFDARCIPSVAYTDPEIAWAGLTETEAKAKGVTYKKAVFPWTASGRALSFERSEGVTKLLVDPDGGHILGAGICGVGAGDLIAEIALAIEMGATAEDLALTIHPHPTLSETVALAAEVFTGSITDL